MVYFEQAFLFDVSFFFTCHCTVMQSHNTSYFTKNYTVEQSCVHTPGLKALAETVCTERCIAFNGGTPLFFFFSSLSNGSCTQSEMRGHKTTCRTSGGREREETVAMRGVFVLTRFFVQRRSTTASLVAEAMGVPQKEEKKNIY